MVNWRLATKPRCFGGLGIRDVQVANQALLMKWLWLWFIPQNNWWKQATVMINDSDRPWNDTCATSFWKNLSSIAPAFYSSVSHQIGQGNTVQFWLDNWCGKAFKYRFPHLFKAAVHQYSSVQQNINSGTWEPQLGQLNLSAQAEKNNLMLCLQNAFPAQQMDEISWLRKPPIFTVSSAYNFLVNTPSPQSNLVNIWKIKAPLRVLVFAWLLLTNRLTTLDNLSRRGWYLPSICIMCRRNEETSHHLFCTCRLAREIREYIYVVFAAQYHIPLSYKSENSICMLTDCAINPQARQWEIATCFVLWRERCRHIFSETAQRHLSLVREIRTEYNFWFGKSLPLQPLPHSD